MILLGLMGFFFLTSQKPVKYFYPARRTGDGEIVIECFIGK